MLEFRKTVRSDYADIITPDAVRALEALARFDTDRKRLMDERILAELDGLADQVYEIDLLLDLCGYADGRDEPPGLKHGYWLGALQVPAVRRTHEWPCQVLTRLTAVILPLDKAS